MEPNEYKVTVELKIDAASLVDASKLADKLLKAVYSLYDIDGYVVKVNK